MTHAERTEILAVIAILEKSKDLLRSRMLGEARGKLQTLVDAAPRYSSVCSNTTNGAHVGLADFEPQEPQEPPRRFARDHCEGCDDPVLCDGVPDDVVPQEWEPPELIDDTACLACGG